MSWKFNWIISVKHLRIVPVSITVPITILWWVCILLAFLNCLELTGGSNWICKICSYLSVICRLLLETLSLNPGGQNSFPSNTRYPLPFCCVDICPDETKAILGETAGTIVWKAVMPNYGQFHLRIFLSQF